MTPNEVDHARTQYPNVALFVLVGIQLERSPNGLVKALGGRFRVFDPWNIDDGRLTPLEFAYSLPQLPR